jgi:LDH2 family malate/lactate/ureidoglycolate dehydrogenase
MPNRHPDELRRLMCALLVAVGTPEATAKFIADSLVDSNLAGHDSHGVIRVIQYLEVVRQGALDPAAEPFVVSRSGATVCIDGGWGWGQPAMQLATAESIALAREFGIALATVDRCFHVGRVAPYVETIARHGMVGLAMVSAGPAVAPYGGRSRVMGTNPIAWAVPRAESREPIALDIATAQVAEGKLRVARAKGLPVAPGTIVDLDGHPSIDPKDYYDGGALVAFGGHKGSGLSILAQLLGMGLAGLSPDRIAGHRGANGPVVIAIDVSRLTPLETFRESVEQQAEAILGSIAADGFEEVLLPGDPEIRERARRLGEGIPVDERTWQNLLDIASDLGIAPETWVLDQASTSVM